MAEEPPKHRGKLSPGELFAAGAGAGVVSKSVTAPLDRIRIVFQVDGRQKFSMRGFCKRGAKILRNEGILGLWRGNLAVVLRVMPYGGIQFAAFDVYQAALGQVSHRPSHEPYLRFCAGALAGATATSVTYPLDYLRAHMAVASTSLTLRPRYSSYVEAAQEIVRSEGAGALFHGLRPTLLGIIPHSGMSFMVFETLKPWIQTEVLGLRSEKDLPMAWRLLAGGVAGFVAQGASYPLHVVRRRMQVQSLLCGDGDTYASVWQGLRMIWAKEGVMGLYKSASLTLIKAPLSSAVGFAANDLLKGVLARASGDPERVPPFLWPDGPHGPDVVRDPGARLNSKDLTPFEHLVSGGVAGAVAKTVIAPGDRLKILYQTNGQRAFSWGSMLRTGRTIYRNTGFVGLWRGHCATLMQQVPKSAVTFFSFDCYRRWIYETEVVDKRSARFLAGAMAGATATTLIYPLDLMRARMAAHWDMQPRYRNYFSALESILQEEGPRGLYRGIRPTLLGIMPYAGLSFFAYETMKAAWMVPLEASGSHMYCTTVRLASGALAGLLAQTATYPLDIVRRRMQVHPGIYRNEWHAMKSIYLAEGLVGGLFKGVSMNWVKGPIAAGVSFTINDLVKKRLGAK